MYSFIRSRPSFSATCAHTVLTEFVSACVSGIIPNCWSEKFASGAPETLIGDLPLTIESG